jgi:hypothetical protein
MPLLTWQNSTRLYDALYTVGKNYEELRDQDASFLRAMPHFMVFLTDGGENASQFKFHQACSQLEGMTKTFKKLIFLTAGSSAGELRDLQKLLASLPPDSYALMSVGSNSPEDIKRLFGFAKEIVEKVVLEYFHKGKNVRRTELVAMGGNNSRELADAALQDIGRVTNSLKQLGWKVH